MNMGTTNFDNVDVSGEFLVDGVAVNPSATTAVTPGTVAASKAVVVDANKDVTGLRNVTTTGSTVLGDAAADTVKLHGTAQSGAQSALVAVAPAGGTGATAGAYDTANNRDAMITLVNAMRTCLINHGLMADA
jgi:hypothetical protein